MCSCKKGKSFSNKIWRSELHLQKGLVLVYHEKKYFKSHLKFYLISFV